VELSFPDHSRIKRAAKWLDAEPLAMRSMLLLPGILARRNLAAFFEPVHQRAVPQLDAAPVG